MNESVDNSSPTFDYEGDCDCAAECSDINVADEESIWTQTSIGYMLDECLKKKKELHDPRHRRNKFFGDIRQQMIAKGFLFSAKTLEKKFYNLKKHFCTICQSRERAAGPGRPITWPYFSKMMEIFAEDLEIDDAPTMASLYPEPSPPNNIAIEKKVATKIEPLSDGELEVFYESGDEETPWTHKGVVTFLQECCRKKHDLWNPKIRRRKIFSEIRQRLRARGYHYYQESLDRKLRNMKKHFQVITEAAQQDDETIAKRRRVSWPYYEQLKEIYGEEIEKSMSMQKNQLTMLSDNSNTSVATLKFRPIAPKTAESMNADAQPQNVQIILAMPVLPQNGQTGVTSLKNGQTIPDCNIKAEPSRPAKPMEPKDTGQPSHWDEPSRSQSPAPNYSIEENFIDFEVRPNYAGDSVKFSLDVLALEERRTIVAEQMAEEFREANKIKEKRLEFARIKLEYANARAKRKKNPSNIV